MIEKERQARENEREKREEETMMSNERGRPAVQARDEREAEKQQEMNMKEMSRANESRRIGGKRRK